MIHVTDVSPPLYALFGKSDIVFVTFVATQVDLNLTSSGRKQSVYKIVAS